MNSYVVRLLVAAAGFLAIAAFGTLGVSANHVTINANLSVTPNIISFSTVFPGEVHLEPINIDLSSAFIANPNLDEVEYRIVQRPKPRTDSEEERAYCRENPTDYARCYRSLCPYLSKTPDNAPANDTGVPAFHDPSATSSIAVGTLAKSESDTADQWIIDLHVPCFMGQCSQDSGVASEYQLDPALAGETFGCDLVVEVQSVPTDAPFCEGHPATIWVDANEIIHGGRDDGSSYNGILRAFDGVDDVIVMYDGNGTDMAKAEDGTDIICGTPGRDLIIQSDGPATVYAYGGNDEVQTGDGDDWIDLGDGNDEVNAGAGNDTIYGGNGDDVITGGNGDDDIFGGEGNNTVSGGNGNDEIVTGSGNDTVSGGNGNDVIRLGGGNDNATGSNDDDELYGEDGNDQLQGGNGDDLLDGGPGTDTVHGGGGTDTCIDEEVSVSCEI